MKPNNLASQCQSQELTIEKLRSYKGFETFSDEQAKKYIEVIKKFARVLLGVHRQNSKDENLKGL